MATESIQKYRSHRTDPVERRAGIAALFCAATIALMLSNPSFTNAARPQHGIADPVLALQMAHDLRDVDAVLSDSPSPDREVMRIKQYEDFAFIAGYAVFYVLMSVLLWRRHPMLAILGAVLGIAAAGLDVAENMAILRVVDTPLSHTTAAMIHAIRDRSFLKWACGFAALGVFSIYFLEDRRLLARLTGIQFAIVCPLGFFGLYENAALIAAPAVIVAGLIGAAATFLLVPPRAQ